MRTLALVLGIFALRTACFADDEAVSFQKQIAPLFVDNCLGCHNPEKPEGEYSMATIDLLAKGGEHGAAVEPGKPEESRLFQMLTGKVEPAMPFEDDPLDAASIALVEAWIRQGAKFDGPNRETPLEEMVPREEEAEWDPDYKAPPPIAALAFSPDGATLAAGGRREITFWDVATGAWKARWSTKGERIADLEYTPDGARLVHAGGTPGRYGEVVLWDVASGQPLRTLLETKDVVFALAVRPGGEEAAAGGADRIFRIWRLADGQELHSVENHADWILGVAYTRDGKRLLTASRDRSAKIWDQEAGEPVVTFALHSDGVYAVAAAPDGATAASVGADKRLRFWKTEGDANQTAEVAAHNDAVFRVVFAPSGKLVFTAGADARVVAWNPADNKAVREYAGHKDYVHSLALSPDESLLAAGGWDGRILVWRVETGEVVADFLAAPALAAERASSP